MTSVLYLYFKYTLWKVPNHSKELRIANSLQALQAFSSTFGFEKFPHSHDYLEIKLQGLLQFV